MLTLCLMLLAAYYAQNYAGIIGWSLASCVTKLLHALQLYTPLDHLIVFGKVGMDY